MSLTKKSKQKRFKNPPILEAIIAVTIQPLPESALPTLKNLSASLAGSGYSLETTMTQYALEFAVEQGVSRAANRDEVRGYQFFSADRRFAFQFLRTIDSVRDTKDHYFFNMLTDKMKETFDA